MFVRRGALHGEAERHQEIFEHIEVTLDRFALDRSFACHVADGQYAAV